MNEAAELLMRNLSAAAKAGRPVDIHRLLRGHDHAGGRDNCFWVRVLFHKHESYAACVQDCLCVSLCFHLKGAF